MLKIVLFTKNFIPTIFYGLSLVTLFAFIATFISELSWFKDIELSPLIIAIALGIIYANTLRVHLPQEYSPGIIFSKQKLLRIAIVFYGFRITYQNIFEVGMSGFVAGTLIVILTFTLGYLIGVKFLKLDLHTTILISAGSSICGAAAVLATEAVLKSESYKTAIAVTSVVVLGSILMFLHPFLYKIGYINLDENSIGVYLGATLHEVANVVAAGNTLGENISNDAVIVKIIRVMMLAPFLLFLGLFLVNKKKKKLCISTPWFALYFIAVAGFNSLELLPSHLIQSINQVDTFALTMSMCALGMETSFINFKNVGLKPLYLSTILFIWLIIGGFYITKLSMNI